MVEYVESLPRAGRLQYIRLKALSHLLGHTACLYGPCLAAQFGHHFRVKFFSHDSFTVDGLLPENTKKCNDCITYLATRW